MAEEKLENAKMRMVEVGAKITQDLGLGRIVGQILVQLYLTDGECSLDEIGENLGLSKAAVSIAARQLESLGLLQRVWKKKDRKSYYKTPAHLGPALKQGLMSFIRQKIQFAATELNTLYEELDKDANKDVVSDEFKFIHKRIKRTKELRDRAETLIENPLLKLLKKTL